MSTVTAEAPGVDGVFHQFLDDRRGALHYLARGDQLSGLFWQYGDFVHWLPPFQNLLSCFVDELVQFVQSFNRSEHVHVYVFQFLVDFVRQVRGERQLFIFEVELPGRAPDTFRLSGVQSETPQNLLRVFNDDVRYTGQLRYLDAVTVVRAAADASCAETQCRHRVF